MLQLWCRVVSRRLPKLFPTILNRIRLFPVHDYALNSKKSAKFPLLRIYFFFSIVYYKCILVETLYLCEDILSQQVLVITKQVHQLADRRCVPCLDLYQPQDI